MENILSVNGKDFIIHRQLGRGKGGYSYLASPAAGGNEFFVLKQIHHEPCSYYTFGDKIQSEINDYRRLKKTGIPMPCMIDVDTMNERILKEYIDGPVVSDIVKKEGSAPENYLNQVKEMSCNLRSAGINIDWYPTNFVVQDEKIFYIDYECNDYMEEWSLENWGIKYWLSPDGIS